MWEKKQIKNKKDKLDFISKSEKTKSNLTYHSSRFQMIEEQVKENLKQQKTDEALYNLTIWALVLWSSDIHYEVFDDEIFVRFRIDWVLVDIFKLTIKEYKLILERLKYASGLKLNIVNIPQDWKYSMVLDTKEVDVRVSTLPVWNYENVVTRILDSSSTIIDFEKLWFFWMTNRMLEKAIKKKNGMILVTGPTWSGKTTTLYTILNNLNTRDKKLITLEDPIEYNMKWIIQSEVDEKIGYTFEKWLKAILRQDPDIIMVWEIRDFQTLTTATQASLTGHLVLSTLHTKSALDTLYRITDMWLKPYILASALDTIIAQRLVRKICPFCKKEKEKTPEEQAQIIEMMKDIWMTELQAKRVKLYKWVWCSKCSNSGYFWRIWIFEIVSINENLRNMIRAWESMENIVKEARKADLITMKEDWILKAIRWYTTIEEILRIL